MSEVEARAPTRGRSSARGGRGGFSRGGPRGGRKQVNGTSHDIASVDDSLEDEGELGEMKKKYSAELGMLKDMFPDWTDIDLVFALEESAGDVPAAVDHITQGNVSQFAEVKKPKDRARSKVKDDFSTAGAADKPAFSARGGRGRGGFEGARGRGGRGSDRGRGGLRGGRGGHATTNGASKETGGTSVPTTESSAWDTPQAAAETGTSASDSTPGAAPASGAWDTTAAETPKESTEAGQSAWGNVVTADSTPAAASEGAKSTLIPEGGAKKSWASMFAQPKPAPVAVPKPAQPKAQPPPAELVASGQILKDEDVVNVPEINEAEPIVEPASSIPEEHAASVETPASIVEPELSVTTPTSVTAGQEVDLTPAHDPLTKENVEHLPDESNPPDTFTAASTTDSQDPRNLTPLPGQQPPIGRPPLGGFATSAQRAAHATSAARSASYQRRVQEQSEAVVMPGHNAVERATVQFGTMGLGEAGMDVDEEREEPETRHAPQHSPPSQPKTSLPPAPRQTVTAQDSLPPSQPEGLPTPKQAPGLPPASQQNQQQIQDSALGQGLPQEPTQAAPGFNQYGGYGQSGLQDSASQQQKPYDPFSHQAAYDRFGTQPPSQSGFGGLSSAPSDYSSYYTADPQRSGYGGYYGGSAGYGPQDNRTQAQQQQEAGMGQQRSASGFGAGLTDTAFGSQPQQQQTQSRYGEAPGSGHNTPNPLMSGIGGQQQQQAAPNAQQSQHPMHQGAGQHQQNAYPGYPYGHPYYSSPYQQAYQNQFGYGQQPSGYGNYPKQQQQQGGMYGAPQGYGSSYEQHSASPANAGAFGQNQQTSMRSASGMGSALGGSSLDDYGRTSAQSGSHNQSGGFNGMNDPFARSASGFGGQAGYGQQQQQQGMTGGSQEDALKPFNDSKSGPSPALGQPGRPESATNSVGGSNQSGMPQQHSQQSAFGGYGGFPSQGSQYGGLGGLGSQQQQQQQGGQQGGYGGQGYGGYGAGFGQTYGGYNGSRGGGGWGQSYSGH